MIRIKNIYYMLSYAFSILNEAGYKNIELEEFDNAADLFAEIIIRGISYQIKKGLFRTYKEECEELSTLKGKLDITASIKDNTIVKKRMICNYDELTINNILNQIIKSTAILLTKSSIDNERRVKLKRLMPYFDSVEIIDLNHANWNYCFFKNNQTYKLLINICYLLVKGLLQSDNNGTSKMNTFLDEQHMCRLYEKFILEYYRKHHYDKVIASASQISWKLDDDNGIMLPIMQSDIMLEAKDKVMIIDAKYYKNTIQHKYDSDTIHSNNLYQIFTYVKNKELEGKPTSGMLLYAKTDEIITPNQSYIMSGNKISVRTLDLDSDFKDIKTQLDNILSEFLMP